MLYSFKPFTHFNKVQNLNCIYCRNKISIKAVNEKWNVEVEENENIKMGEYEILF